MQCNIRLDLEVEIYTREIFSLLDVIYQTGGAFNALTVIGFLLVNLIGSKLFYAEMIDGIFKYKDPISSSPRNRG